MKKVVVICGPTAVGKTKLSILLAKQFGAEIISADSQQVYRGFDIGSAKITEAEKDNIPHHLIDILEPNESFDVALFQKLVREKLNVIQYPFLVGGTGLYIKAALYDYEFNTPKRTSAFESQYDHMDNESLYELLKEINATKASEIHMNNRRRVLRALEMLNEDNKITFKKDIPLYDILVLYCNMPREILYPRIDERVIRMMSNGLLEEVKSLKDKGIYLDTIGFRELYHYLDGRLSIEDAVATIQQKTRHLAKKQETWFKNQMHAHMIDMQDINSAFDEAKKLIETFYKGDL